MGDPKMTARERLRPHSIRHEEDELGVVSRVVLLDVAIQIAEEHAAAAVKDLEARVAELERERDEARGERDFQRERAQVNVDQREEAWARVAELERKRSRALGALTNVQRQLSQAEARVAELEGILHDAPTIDAVESHVPGWLARVRAALGKEAQT